ncbi:uroporphyrinogen-III synthase [Paracoccus aestuariivivens]|uniref:Uroporphyrinogen-III synthase n=1 Tax=Paracoccus aestuariivivens TaxID=1820333 RepID=A0A6L6JAF1_9RHOB|nr:uroporphyrinogen-III synthase [Paracoccus aestuariivivens]MTH78980.1 uroporphyrinogen-III synthase [Paracoccus aestuariivivens]
MPPSLLLTRPEDASRRFAAGLAHLHLPVVISPVLRIVPVAHDKAGIAAATGLVFTSVNAVPAAGAGRGRPAICVGPATAEAARKAGFSVTEGPGDAARMLPLLAGLGPGWLHPHGRHIAKDLPVSGIVVYDQLPELPSPQAVELLAGAAPVIVPIFSPRSAALVSDWVRAARAPLWLATISAAAQAAWRHEPARSVIALTPDAAGMRVAVESLAAEEPGGQRRVEAPSGGD